MRFPFTDNTLIYVFLVLAFLIFLIGYYFIRKSLQPKDYFNNKMLSTITHQDKEEYLLYCISFFQDAYDSNELPHISIFTELRIRTSVVFTFYKKVKHAAYVYMKLRKYYYKNKPLPDFTNRYKEKLKEDGRKADDIIGAFCLYGVEEFSKLLE